MGPSVFIPTPIHLLSEKYLLGVYYVPGTICKIFLIRRELYN